MKVEETNNVLRLRKGTHYKYVLHLVFAGVTIRHIFIIGVSKQSMVGCFSEGAIPYNSSRLVYKERVSILDKLFI